MTADIVVHGLGYVGLTAAVHFAKAGWKVLGYDPDQAVVSAIRRGEPRAGEFLRYLDADVSALVTEGRLRATDDFEEMIKGSKRHLIAVPTEKDGKPYDRVVVKVLRQLLVNRLGPPLTILIESTLTPGTIDQFMDANSTAREAIGLGAMLAVCPRRDWFADPTKNLATLQRVVGGYNGKSTDEAITVLSSVTPVDKILVTDYRTAEICKALENALLHVPVMFAHQLSLALPNHNVAEALRLAGTHWRLMPLHLGFGTGGRCVPLGTEYLVSAALEGSLPIGVEALDADENFREDIAAVVCRSGARTAIVLGAAYRPDFRDAGRSPGISVAKRLAARLPSGSVAIHDPLWSASELTSMVGIPAFSGSVGSLREFDVVLLATPHSGYEELPYVAIWKTGHMILDAQGAWDRHRNRFSRQGIIYKQVGEPGWTDLRS